MEPLRQRSQNRHLNHLARLGTGQLKGPLVLDFAAVALIAARAGAMVTDRLGAPWHFNAGRPQAAGVVVAPGLHGALIGGWGRWKGPREGGMANSCLRNA